MDKELLYLPRKLKKKLFYLQLSEKEILELMDSIPGGNYDEPRVVDGSKPITRAFSI